MKTSTYIYIGLGVAGAALLAYFLWKRRQPTFTIKGQNDTAKAVSFNFMGIDADYTAGQGPKNIQGRAGYMLKIADGPTSSQYKAVYFELFKNGSSLGVLKTINFPVGTGTPSGTPQGPQQNPS